MSARVVRLALVAVPLFAAQVAGQVAPQAPTVAEQGLLVSRALEHENAGRTREAVAAWRAVLTSGAMLAGVAGLERAFAIVGQDESLLVALDTLIPRHPREGALRAAQLRVLSTAGRERAAELAFVAWRELVPKDVAPYREYARLLLLANRAMAADTVIRAAEAALGTTRALVMEVAQMRAALGLWGESAAAWREAMATEPYFETTAVFSLTPAPADRRDAVRGELRAPRGSIGATHVLAMLELAWGSPRRGWQVLTPLPPSDTVVAIWRDYADEVERRRSWSVAMEAFVAIHAARPDAQVAIRGAKAALAADDASTALRLARAAAASLDPDRQRRETLPLELDALARMGRATEVESRLAALAPSLGAEGMRAFARTRAWGWIRAGNVVRAREVLRDAPLDAEDAVSGWLALFDGDLAGARGALRNLETPGLDALHALALLNRTTATRAPGVGEAFLALARADTAGAARRFEGAAGELSDAAPLLLALAARLESARRDDARALPLWRRIAESHAEAPEAPEAWLEWSRTLRRRGDVAGARQKLEHLILTYPGSALVPQARRELDALAVGE